MTFEEYHLAMQSVLEGVFMDMMRGKSSYSDGIGWEHVEKITELALRASLVSTFACSNYKMGDNPHSATELAISVDVSPDDEGRVLRTDKHALSDLIIYWQDGEARDAEHVAELLDCLQLTLSNVREWLDANIK